MNASTGPDAIRRPLSVQRLFEVARSRTGVLAIATAGTFVVRTLSSVVLTRLLTPYAFGIIGIISSVFFAVTMVTDLGFEAFIIRHQRSEDRHFRDVLWTIHVKRGLALFLVVAVCSPLIAALFGKPVVALPMAVAATIFFINGAASLSLMTALRNDKAREISLLEFGLQVFQTTVCILLALWWRNVWSMIAAMIIQNILRTLISFRLFADSGQRLQKDPAISREFLAFSRVILMSSALTLLISQSDKFVLGRLFTLSEFGLYSIAVTIASAPAAFCESYARRIALPVYSQTWRDAPGELAGVYYRVRRSASALYAFACGGLIGGAPLLVAILYDQRYAPAAKYISILMIATALRLPNVAASEFVTAVGDMGRMLRITVIRVVWLALAIPVGFIILRGIGVVAAVGLVEVPALLYCWMLLRRLGVLDLRQEGTYLALVAAGAAIGWFGGSTVLALYPAI